MLKRFWLWLGRLLGKTLFVLLIVGLRGWAIGTAYYSWKFSGPVSSEEQIPANEAAYTCLLYTSPSPRDLSTSRMPSSA